MREEGTTGQDYGGEGRKVSTEGSLEWVMDVGMGVCPSPQRTGFRHKKGLKTVNKYGACL